MRRAVDTEAARAALEEYLDSVRPYLGADDEQGALARLSVAVLPVYFDALYDEMQRGSSDVAIFRAIVGVMSTISATTSKTFLDENRDPTRTLMHLTSSVFRSALLLLDQNAFRKIFFTETGNA